MDAKYERDESRLRLGVLTLAGTLALIGLAVVVCHGLALLWLGRADESAGYAGETPEAVGRWLDGEAARPERVEGKLAMPIEEAMRRYVEQAQAEREQREGGNR